MNYKAHYERLIDRARDRYVDGYTETHHIVPRCLGGTNDDNNLVRLTPQEHFVAHQLLAKLYPNNRGLICAAVLIAKKAGNNKTYGWLSIRRASLLKGRIVSPETRAKISASSNGRKMPPRSAAYRAKMAAAHIGRKRSAEWRANIAASLRGKRVMTPEWRARISASNKGKKQTPESILKRATANTGKKRSPEQIARLTIGQRLRHDRQQSQWD